MDALFQIDELSPAETINNISEADEEYILGNEDIEQQLLEDYNSKSMPCAYIYSGVKGVGKLQMAHKFVSFLLAEDVKEKKASEEGKGLFGDELPRQIPRSLDIKQNNLFMSHIDAKTHPNVLTLELDYNFEKNKQKTEISINDSRKIGDFLSLTLTEGKYKIIIINPIDAMNNRAANAILKWLEEPPKNTLFILITHAIGSILPTIRSRCRQIHFRTPDITIFHRDIKIKFNKINDNEIEQLYKISSGSVGISIDLYQNGALKWLDGLYELIENNNIDIQALHKLATINNKKKSNQLTWDNITLICQSILSRIIKAKSTPSDEEIINIISKRKDIDYWFAAWDKVPALMKDSMRLYLDKKTVLIEVIIILSGNNK